MNLKPLLRLSLGFLSGVISWFIGWLLYAFLDLWTFIKPAEFQNILVVTLGFCTLVGAVFAHRALRSETVDEIKSPRSKGQPELKKMREDIDILKVKVEEMHAFFGIFKARKEAEAKT